MARYRPHLLLTAVYVMSRALLYALGLRFSFELDWMWLADAADLRDRLAQTLFYFHAFPPGMNAFTGMVLEFDGGDGRTLAQICFWMMGVVGVNALFYLARAVGLSRVAALVFALAFTMTPPAIYFEHLFHYEWPILTMMCVAAVLFHRAVERQTFVAWSGFFVVSAVVGLTRSTFHLVWLVALVMLAVLLARRHTRRTIVICAMAPVLLLSALYAKNLLLFGDFAASTFGPASYTLATVGHLTPETRNTWITEGWLSPFAAISVYAPPRAYSSFFTSPDHQGWPPQLTRLVHPSVRAANFNHWWLLEVHRRRRGDAMRYLRDRPLEYAQHVTLGLRDLFRPSTTWHPRDGTPASPHHQHREVLGAYERTYNAAIHTLPAPPVGLYVLLPVVLTAALAIAARLRRSSAVALRARAALMFLFVFQIVYVVAASSMLTFLESSRYRFQIEPMIWLVAIGAVINLKRVLSPGLALPAGPGFSPGL